MGHGSYSYSSTVSRAADLGYAHKSSHEIFTQRKINNAMSPYGVVVRESRDSAEHPNSVAIIIALDVTGSMGSVPTYLVKEGFAEIMKKIIDAGIPDPQVLFVAIGDHECDSAPLQIGQFESSDELLEHWLTTVYLEGGGGGNAGESYHLAWYFAAKHTDIDCFNKRGQKGILFTIGDEPVLKRIPSRTLKEIMGNGQYSDETANELINEASKKYELFHIHIKETNSGSRQSVINEWNQLLPERVIPVGQHTGVVDVIANKVIEIAKKYTSVSGVVLNVEPIDGVVSTTAPDSPWTLDPKPAEDML